MTIKELNNELGNVDLFLLDKILKGEFEDQRILDAGCGEGRNIIYFLKNKYDVYGVDTNSSALKMLEFLSKSSGVEIKKNQFQEASITQLPFSEQKFDRIICHSVLHSANDHDDFITMITEMQRVLRENGLLLIQMPFVKSAYENQKISGKINLTDELRVKLLSSVHLSEEELILRNDVLSNNCIANWTLRKVQKFE